MILPTIPEMVFVDLETTGATATRDRITEIGIVHVSERGVDRFNQLIHPQARIPDFIARLTGISDEMVRMHPYLRQLPGT